MILFLILPLLACSAPSPGARAQTDAPPSNVVVDCDGGGDHVTLGEAIAASADGDTIDVLPCTYMEQVNFAGHSVTLRATAGPAETIIDAGGAGPAVIASGGEGDGTALVGFTLTGGVEVDYGAALFVDLSRIRLERVVVTGNRGSAIVYSHAGDIELLDVTFTGNTVTEGGSAFTLYRGALNASALDIACDGGAYAMYLGHGSGLIDASKVGCSTGTALYYEHATGRVERTRLEGLVVVINEDDHDTDVVTMENDIFVGGQGIYVEYGTALLRNSVVNGTLTLAGVANPVVEANVFLDGRCAIDADAGTSALAPSYNDLWRVSQESCDGTTWSGIDGNFASDPMFTDEAAGDYTLAVGSPCIDRGLPEEAQEDTDGSRNDVGAHGGRKPIVGDL
ncbi:MAG: hypothetical protein Q8P41_11625 [Pseudomonadota bacterium]|nr:hypothetical protein [Pseudomonadota bacterium]